MPEDKNQDLMQKVWRIQEVLQAASAGDFSHRLETSISTSFEADPLTPLAPAINLLLDDLSANERKQERVKKQLRDTVEELQQKLTTIREQAAAIRELSTPVMEIWDDVLLLPIVGVVDTKRSMDIMDALLRSIVESQTRCVILDITGVEIVDTRTADYLLKVVRAAGLLGARCVLTGLSPAVAQTLVEIGADLGEVTTLRSIKDGLRECLQHLGRGRTTTDGTPRHG
jgi:rsbT co-antagonist protein RsbR